MRMLEEICNVELKEIDIWFRANKLTANFTKSKFMLSTSSRTFSNNSFEIKMGESSLERVKSIKYLGVMLDDQLSWNSHVQYLNKKLSSACGILGKIKYYVDVPTLMKIYHALFKSRKQYAIISWGSANKTTLQPLRVIQNCAAARKRDRGTNLVVGVRGYFKVFCQRRQGRMGALSFP